MGCSGSNQPVQDFIKALIVVGPSGVGKDTVMQKVVDKHPDKFKKAVTHTTRSMRPGEKEGFNYYYVTREAFESLLKEDGFIEHNEYNKNLYGLSKKELEDGTKSGKIVYAIIDINGATAVSKLPQKSNFLAILPPSDEVLEKRLKGRGTEDPEAIKRRLDTAKEETKRISETKFFNIKLINTDLDKAVEELDEKLKALYPQLK